MIKTQEGRHKKTSLATYSPLTLLQGFERVVEGLHVRGCWRPNVNFIFWPHCYDRHVVSCSPDVGVHFIGAFRGPPWSGVAFPYHIWSLLSGIILATASGVSEVPLGRVWPSLQHLVSSPLGVCWQLLRGGSECPLGRVWPSLPHLVSTVWKSAGNCIRGVPRSPSVGCGLPYHISSLTLWESAGNCFGTPNSTELNNNSTPTRSPTGSLNRMFNRHQAEITVMQFRGYSLLVHDCNGTMRPSPCPIS